MDEDIKSLPPKERVARLKAERERMKEDDGPRLSTSVRFSDEPIVEAAEKAKAESQTKKASPRKTAAPTSAGVRYTPGMFVEQLTMVYTAVGMGISAFDKHAIPQEDGTVINVPLCGMAIANNAENIAVQWDKLAEKNPAVRRTLVKMMQGGAWAGVIGAHLPILGAIMGNHFPALMPNLFHKDGENAG